MRIARIFDLLDADSRSPLIETELKEASDIWGIPTEQTLAMVVWLKMLAERGRYRTLIEGARHLFTQELGSIETIEKAYRALPPAFIVEPLHSQGLTLCADARLKLVFAIQALNHAYQSNQDDAPTNAEYNEALNEHQSNQFHQLHSSFMHFYREMEELEARIATIKEVAKASSRDLSPLLEEAKRSLEKTVRESQRIRRKIRTIIRALSRKASQDFVDVRQLKSLQLRDENDRKVMDRVIQQCEALLEEHEQVKKDMEETREEIKQLKDQLRSFGLDEGEFTIEEIAARAGVSKQATGTHIRKLRKERKLHSMNREGKKHKAFTEGEVRIITHNWPSIHRTSRGYK